MIVPVGLEKERVSYGCKIYPVNVVYLLCNPKPSAPDTGLFEYTNHFAKEVKKDIKNSFRETLVEDVKLNSYIESLKVLNFIFEKEFRSKSRLNKIYINVSTASKNFALAAYTFACQHPDLCKIFYLKTNRYILLEYIQKYLDDPEGLKRLKKKFLDKGLTEGDENGNYIVEEIPLIRTIQFKEEEISILKVLVNVEEREIGSIKGLMKLLGFKPDAAVRINLKRILNKFEREHLIEQIQHGKQVKIKLKDQLITMKEILGL